jgi:hypothetical protein
MVASEIRALFAVAARPEIMSLAGGMPFIAAGRSTPWARWPASSSPTAGRWPCSTALQGAGLDLGAACRDLLGLAAARGS